MNRHLLNPPFSPTRPFSDLKRLLRLGHAVLRHRTHHGAFGLAGPAREKHQTGLLHRRPHDVPARRGSREPAQPNFELHRPRHSATVVASGPAENKNARSGHPDGPAMDRRIVALVREPQLARPPGTDENPPAVNTWP